MPNGYGSLPDCIHCTYLMRSPNSVRTGHCSLHNTEVPWILYVLCSRWVENHPDGKGLLDEHLNRSQLDDELIYTWIPLKVRYPDGTTGWHIAHESLGTIQQFGTWSEDDYLNRLDILAQAKQEELQRTGIEPL
jgi:hypothetical protein